MNRRDPCLGVCKKTSHFCEFEIFGVKEECRLQFIFWKAIGSRRIHWILSMNISEMELGLLL